MNDDAIWFCLQCNLNVSFQVISCCTAVRKFVDVSSVVDCSSKLPDGDAMNVTVPYKAEFILFVVV